MFIYFIFKYENFFQGKNWGSGGGAPRKNLDIVSFFRNVIQTLIWRIMNIYFQKSGRSFADQLKRLESNRRSPQAKIWFQIDTFIRCYSIFFQCINAFSKETARRRSPRNFCGNQSKKKRGFFHWNILSFTMKKSVGMSAAEPPESFFGIYKNSPTGLLVRKKKARGEIMFFKVNTLTNW